MAPVTLQCLVVKLALKFLLLSDLCMSSAKVLESAISHSACLIVGGIEDGSISVKTVKKRPRTYTQCG
ncbi:hypothetical protein OK016_23685 [Vibrio chagasii]|nr:hypothetical protein [Vibrio chagasii]